MTEIPASPLEVSSAEAILRRTVQDAEERGLSAQRWERLVVWSRIADLPHTGHAQRVAEITRSAALHLGWTEAGAEELAAASLLHDIGKIGVPPELLQRRGPLSPGERTVVEHHTRVAARIFRGVTHPRLVLAREMACLHHERFDGSGYPLGLAAGQIPMGARLVAVADVWDAVTGPRCYRSPLTHSEARRELESARGTQYDPDATDAVLAVVSHQALEVA